MCDRPSLPDLRYLASRVSSGKPMPHGLARSSRTRTESEATSANAGTPPRYEAGSTRFGGRLAADILNARRLDDPPNVTSRGVPGAVGPGTFSDRDQWARRISLGVSYTHAFDELGHGERSAQWVPIKRQRV